MNSFSTSSDTNEYLKKYPEYADPSEVEMLQNFSPKVFRGNLEPVCWPKDDKLEWCPPGHGDIYTALYGSGWLDKLLDQGIKYAFISREVAQCPDKDLDSFQDISKHQYFNTNNLWLRLDVLKEKMDEYGGVLPLPVITNKKTTDPRNASSPAVYQLETAMGAAIECFSGAGAVCVPRRRFAPVKKTSDLLCLRSDAYKVHPNGRVMLIHEREGIPPIVELDNNYKFVDQVDELGIPSLKEAKKLSIKGKVRFEDGVVIKGEVSIINDDDTYLIVVPAGVYENEIINSDE